MPRADLLALSREDLELLSNKGVVKRALRELTEREAAGEISESAQGDIAVVWSDGVTCGLPAGKTLHDCQCTCATGGICRHIVRSVFAYQELNAPAAKSNQLDEEATEAPADTSSSSSSSLAAPANIAAGEVKVWSPGDIDDETLAKYFKPAVLLKARKLFESGLVIELVKSVKPFARFHSLSYTIRFLVRADVRYTHCDCSESPPPCSHAAVAVWAFRGLSSEQTSAIISSKAEREPVPKDILDTLEEMLVALSVLGIGGAAQALSARLKQTALACQDGGLIWPAEIINDLVVEIERYQASDARYSELRVAELVAELAARMDAIRNDTGVLPQMFIRGAQTDRAMDITTARFVGLGCGGTIRRKNVELTAYFQDQTTGNVVTVTREFDMPSAERKNAFFKLSSKPVVKGTTLRQLGAGLVMTKGGKLSPSREFNPSRTALVVNPQMFKWEENLKAPVFAENFAELLAMLAARPPLYLAPRYKGSRFYVCAVASAATAQFLEAQQCIYSELVDQQGAVAHLMLPFHSFCSEGTDILLDKLQNKGQSLRFVAGSVHAGPAGLLFEPVSCIFEENGVRTMVQPWVDKFSSSSEPDVESEAPDDEQRRIRDPLQEYPSLLLEQLGQTLTVGLDRADAELARQWAHSRDEADNMGLSVTLNVLADFAAAIETRRNRLDWDGEVAARRLLDLAVLGLVAREEVMR